tara:strand:+ start:322 stop:624 length:303 start_codon:yes stop_codon:yes gene_type:complete
VNLNKFFISILIILFFSGCQTIKQKTDEIVKKENEKLSQFIGQPVSELKIVLGMPDEIVKSEVGNDVLIYNTKKYGIPCERKFETNKNEMVIGFISKGCF